MFLTELSSYVAPYYGPVTGAIIKVPHLIRPLITDAALDVLLGRPASDAALVLLGRPASALGSGKGLNRFTNWIIND
jgi:hypothetical protein